VIPQLGQFIANDKDSYQYLVESIRKFPKQTEFAKLIEDAGFKVVTYTNLTGGIVAIHSGFKL
jgi:ubiquinone/menaquinone biosynthesis C-methylase UbiE